MNVTRSQSMYVSRPAPLQTEAAQAPAAGKAAASAAPGPAGSAHAAPVSATPPASLSASQLQVSTDPQQVQGQLKNNISKALQNDVDPAKKTQAPWYQKLLRSEGMLLLGLTVAAASVGAIALPLLCLGAVALLREPQLTEDPSSATPQSLDQDDSSLEVNTGSGGAANALMSKLEEAQESHRAHAEHMSEVLDWNGLDISLDQITHQDGSEAANRRAQSALTALEKRLREAHENNEPEVRQAVQWGSFTRLTALPTEQRADALAQWPADVLRHALAEAQRLSDPHSTTPPPQREQAHEMVTLLKGGLLQRNEALP